MLNVVVVVSFSLALGTTWRLPAAVSIAATYGAMLASQTRGVRIVAALHNETAGTAASEPLTDVGTDFGLDALCAGYEAHHWESTSNCLHAAGMLLAFKLVLAAFVQPSLSRALKEADSRLHLRDGPPRMGERRVLVPTRRARRRGSVHGLHGAGQRQSMPSMKLTSSTCSRRAVPQHVGALKDDPIPSGATRPKPTASAAFTNLLISIVAVQP
mmetsp:Transcript_11726/g.37440  ORF Transcript_11726/g.37440 Transcript_11726/m.37440 type:complete len:214 (+) Transcript_11726:281-922(+)